MPNSVTISASTPGDLAAAINAALQDPAIDTVILEAGVYLLHSSIVVPSGKTLTGAGQGQTILRAAADFEIIGPSDNAVIVTERFADAVTISDMTVDAGKILPGGLRLNGLFMKFATDFDVARVDAGNATGYAFFAQGDTGSYAPGRTPVEASGRFTDCNSFNSQVHFEQMAANGITLTNCDASDGDGDIPVEAYFHVLAGSSNISYIDCDASGSGFLGFSLLSSVRASTNILIQNCNIEILNPSSGSALIALGGLPIDGLTIIDSSFVSENYIAFRIGGVTGTATNSYFQGRIMAIQSTTSGDGTPSNFTATDSSALGLGDPATGLGVTSVHADGPGYLIWNGGTLEARANVMFPVSGAPTVSPETAIIIDGYDVIVQYAENDPAIALFPGLAIAAGAGSDFTDAVLTIDFVAFGGPTNELSVAEGGPLSVSGNQLILDGEVIGHFSGGANGAELVVVFTAAADEVAVDHVLGAIAYRDLSELPVTNARSMVATLRLANGTSEELTSSISISAFDDPPVLDLGETGATFAEGGAAVAIAPDATVDDIDSTVLSGATLTVEIVGGYAAGDRIVVTPTTDVSQSGNVLYYQGIGIATILDGGPQNGVLIQFNSGGSLAAVQAMVRAIGFSSTSDDPGTATRSISFDLQNGSSPTTLIPVGTIEVSPADDPAIANDDTASTSENAPVLIDVTGNDSDPDERLDTVISVNGISILPGQTVTLTTGATVTLNAFGVLAYDPAGSFGYLAAPGSGSTVTQAIDTFSYGLSGGSEASVSVTVTGEASPDDVIVGSVDADTLTAILAGQTLLGLDNNDVLNDGGLGAVLAGGSGNDAYLVESLDTVITEHASEGTDRVLTSLTRFVLPDHFEILRYVGTGQRFTGYGNAGDNVIRGGDLADTLVGYAGNDRLEGGAGNDILNGGAGFDILDGGAGGDVMLGGTSNDIYYVDNVNDHVIEFAGGGYDTVFVSLGIYLLPDQVENASYTGVGTFEGHGNGLGNQLRGGYNGDLLDGGAGNDVLYGYAGNDTLLGGEGDDRLVGGYGNDQLTGGAGADIFQFDLSLSASNVDHITDFTSGEDLFQLARTIFSTLESGALSEQAFTLGTEASDEFSRIIYDEQTGSLYYDPDGTGPLEQALFATITSGASLNYYDFFVV